MIRICFKRILNFLPAAGIYFLALGLAALAFALGAQSFLFKDGVFDAVKVACYLPCDSKLNGIGFSMVSTLNGVKGSVNLIRYDSKQEVLDAVEKHRAVAGLIIPEGFVSGISYGDNPEIEVIFRSSDTIDELLVNDVISLLADELGIGQATIKASYFFCLQKGTDSKTADFFVDSVSSGAIDAALNQLEFFKFQDIDDISVFTLSQKIIAGAVVYIFLLSVFVFSYFCKSGNPAFAARAKLSGVSRLKFFMSEALCVFVMMYIIFIPLFGVISLAGLGISARALVMMAPVILILALIVSSMCFIFKSPVSASYVSFVLFMVLAYLAGGLLPLEFLPRFLQKGAVFNPLFYIIRFCTEAMFK